MTITTPLKLIFAGAGEFGLPTLRALLDAGHDIAQVITQPDRHAGRGRKVTPTPIAQFAVTRALPLLKTANINEHVLPPADVLVVIAFGQKIGQHIVGHPRLGSVNLHGSRLPKYRGAAPIHAALLAGEKTVGNTIIRLAEKMDAGDVLAMSELPIGDLETAGELHDRLASDGAALMLQVLEDLATGRAVERPQDHAHATIARKLTRASAQIDWMRPADEISRQIRAMHPWPACHVRVVDGETNQEYARAALVRARPTVAHGESRIGHIEWSGAVTAGTGAVEVVELQPEGGRVMDLASFRNGHAWKPGMRVESI